MTVMRYPGGNFASGYHWRDGIGPRTERPTVRELAWQSIETNQFGTDEFIGLARRMDWTPMLAVNLGTGTPEEARDWVEYCNAPVGTREANRRVANGNADPFAVPLWCLGNEMDGAWQLGHVPAREYAIRAQQAAKMMRDVDPAIELVVCGSSTSAMPTFATWDEEVLEYVGDVADYVSLHRYVDNNADDTPDFLAVGRSIDRQIERIDAVCRTVQAKLRRRKRQWLCFDEWNVWYKNMDMDGAGTHAPHLIEEIYNLEDALVVAQFLNSFIRHADVVKIANFAQVVNVIAPLVTRGDELLVQTIFHPFAMMSKRRTGIALEVVTEGPSYRGRTNGTVSYVDASAILGTDALHVFAVNRSVDEAATVVTDVPGHTLAGSATAQLVTGPGAKASNSFEHQDVVVPVAFDDVLIDGGSARFELPPLSFAAISLTR